MQDYGETKAPIQSKGFASRFLLPLRERTPQRPRRGRNVGAGVVTRAAQNAALALSARTIRAW